MKCTCSIQDKYTSKLVGSKINLKTNEIYIPLDLNAVYIGLNHVFILKDSN